MLSRTAPLARRALPLALNLHTTPRRLVESTSESSDAEGRRSSTYDTVSGTKDPFKTVSSGYPQSDQGVPLENVEGLRPEELAEASANPSAEGAERPKEMQMEQTLSESTKTGLIGG
jgi:hypothetical protein